MSRRRIGALSIAVATLAAVPAAMAMAAPVSAVTLTPSVSRAAVPAYPGVLQIGSRGAEVTAVQRGLRARHYAIAGLHWGWYGVGTGAAVLKFKHDHPGLGLGSTNRVGPLTYTAITGFRAPVTSSNAGVPSSSPHYTDESQCPRGADPTTTAAAHSAAGRAKVSLSAFVHSPMGCKVTVRESGGDCRVVDSSGSYMGKWQLDMWEWPTFGGLAFAARPNLASCAQQDVVAYRNWRARGWEPWTTAY